MLTRIFASTALSLILFASIANADDANAIGTAHSKAFAKACGAGDIPGVLALYEDDATVIWPAQGDIAHGKAEIEKLATALCKAGQPGPKLQSQTSKRVGPGYIVNVGMWDLPAAGPDGKPVTSVVRTTEVIHLVKGKWLYTVDHASIGLPPMPTGASAASK
jgi:ketosteroid isomerase-like protein